MDTRLPEKAAAQAQYTQKKAICLRKSETCDRGFSLMARNDLSTNFNAGEELASTASLVPAKGAAISAAFVRGH